MSGDIDIFLSYARGDYERVPPSARLLFQALEDQGWTVFWDRRLKSGENIYKAIPARILESGCVVVAWSKDAVDSDWVLGEADRGRQLGKLFPVLLDRVVPPMPFGGYHANDLSDWAGDVEHGVWKAPAGRQACLPDGYIPQYAIQTAEHEALNPLGINAIRQFDSNAPVLFGARTLAPPDDTQWRYLSVRRMVIFIKKSIDEATQWTVFEPNGPGLWSSLKQSIDEFMNSLWRMGAFPGTTPDEAWFVRCGLGESMTQHDIDEGSLVFEVGVAVIKPSEFVVVRFSHSQP